MSITMQVPVIFSDTATTPDDELQLIREMGVSCVDLNLDLHHAQKKELEDVLAHLEKFGLHAGNLSCMPLQKNKSIDLGLEDRDQEIEKFIQHVQTAAAVGVPLVSIAWQPNGILRSGRKALKSAHYGITGYADLDEITARPPVNGRAYTLDEIWSNFEYFLDKVLPVCEKEGVRMALHPNDPPVDYLAGVGSLIYRTEDYNHAFALADESPALCMKMCIGCWLEGGRDFGDLFQDIEDFVKRGKIAVVHFRNVTSTVPYFEEVLAEDGYADMYAIMKKFVECGYDGLMSVDHVFSHNSGLAGSGEDACQYVVTAMTQDRTENRTLGYCYPTGYAKGLLHAAEAELGIR